MDYEEFLLAVQLIAEDRYGRFARRQAASDGAQLSKSNAALRGSRS